MSQPNAPMPLASQVANSGSITVTIPLKALGAPPNFQDGGSTFNSGSPTATFTYTIGATNRSCDDLIDMVEQLWREGTLVGT